MTAENPSPNWPEAGPKDSQLPGGTPVGEILSPGQLASLSYLWQRRYEPDLVDIADGQPGYIPTYEPLETPDTSE